MKIMSKLKAVSAAAATLAAVLASTPVLATPIASQFFPGQLNQLSDNNAEYLVNADGSLSNAGDSKLDLGDRLVGSFTIETIENLTGGGQTNNLNASGRELTGFFDVTVRTKVDLSLFGGNGFAYTFGATDANGIAIRLFDDAVQDYSRIDGGVGTKEDRLAALMATAKGGLSFIDLGINKYWSATTTTDDIALLGSLPTSQAVNTFLVSLSIINNNSGLLFNQVSCGVSPTGPLALHQTDVCGSGSLLGRGGATTPFDSFSNVDFSVNLVPEPSSIALAGLALLAAGGVARRRKS